MQVCPDSGGLMEFAYPAAFAGLALIPLLFIFNLYKYRRLRVTVGSLIVWKRMSAHAEAPPSSKQRYFNLSLILQIIVIASLTTAIAGPRIRHTSAESRTVHIIIDRSASTEANSAGSRVFERITLNASMLLEQLADRDLLHCHAFPGSAGIETTGPLNPAQARNWLSRLKPTQLPGNIADAALQIAARAAHRQNQVFLFTDQTVTDLPSSIHVCTAPADAGNLAITVAKAALEPDGMYIFFRIANFSSVPLETGWTVIGAGGQSHAASGETPVKLQPGDDAGISRILTAEAGAEKALEIRLLAGDALESDNSAYLFRNPAAKLKISYIGRQNRQLLRILSALPGAIVTFTKTPEPDCSLAVFNESSPAVLPACNAVVIAPPAGIPQLLMASGSQTYKLSDSLAANESELFTNPEVSKKIVIRKALRAALRRHRGANKILADGDTPLIVDFSLEGRKLLYTGFKLTDTNWHNQVSFPLFWGLLAERIGTPENEWTSCTTGGTVILPTRGLSGITSPAGDVLTPAHTGPRILFRPESVGLYRATYTDSEGLFAASLLSPGESRLSDKNIPFNPSWLAPPGETDPQTSPVWLWQYFAFIAALAMLMTWLLWHERKKE
jgi:hypothetical protein